ncbi:DUF397 domain-containing protein [Amycolatopsis sp. FDAARGOS 1241]|uniref:DUF397 domain-containing protein n=1 Tax=Amycolatopsis sp. FDAARGOS 1241 TaxID=2778070 RepID=UPI00194DCB26|nr:DUF397 domain-containing protein [Amycolatopsis sp. FDAARGOS 1241]QRP43589.1 DUF397 domain-containing protein [Amycolatopsis sp. FDAARGOS 1241]
MSEEFAGRWRKASASNASSDCVEVAVAGHGEAWGIRDSKDPRAGYIELGGAGWQGLLEAIKAQ